MTNTETADSAAVLFTIIMGKLVIDFGRDVFDLDHEFCGECGRERATNPDNDLCAECEAQVYRIQGAEQWLSQ